MVKFSAKSHTFEESWSTVTLAFFLRYPNPYAAHVLSCDVLSRTPTLEGSLITKRLMLKRGAVPKWLPRGIVSRAESWIVEESEVDPWGKVVRCTTKNLDHVKILSVKEDAVIKEAHNGCVTRWAPESHVMADYHPYVFHRSTIHKTEVRLVSNFGWGLAKRIERYGHDKFERNMERVSLHFARDAIQKMDLNETSSPERGYRLSCRFYVTLVCRLRRTTNMASHFQPPALYSTLSVPVCSLDLLKTCPPFTPSTPSPHHMKKRFLTYRGQQTAATADMEIPRFQPENGDGIHLPGFTRHPEAHQG